MQASTSIEPDSTETQTTPQRGHGSIIPYCSGDGSATPPIWEERAILIFDNQNLPRRNPLQAVIDNPEEERKHATQLRNRMARGRLSPAQDSTASPLSIERQSQDMIIESLGPKRRFRVKARISSVRRAEPPDMDPSWVL